MNLDGVDLDLENLGAGCTGGALSASSTVSWMATTTTAARAVLSGGGGGFITHAPQAPYFGPVGVSGSSFWAGSTGCYSGVYQQVGSSIDWLNVQFYNQVRWDGGV